MLLRLSVSWTRAGVPRAAQPDVLSRRTKSLCGRFAKTSREKSTVSNSGYAVSNLSFAIARDMASTDSGTCEHNISKNVVARPTVTKVFQRQPDAKGYGLDPKEASPKIEQRVQAAQPHIPRQLRQAQSIHNRPRDTRLRLQRG